MFKPPKLPISLSILQKRRKVNCKFCVPAAGQLVCWFLQITKHKVRKILCAKTASTPALRIYHKVRENFAKKPSDKPDTRGLPADIPKGKRKLFDGCGDAFSCNHVNLNLLECNGRPHMEFSEGKSNVDCTEFHIIIVRLFNSYKFYAYLYNNPVPDAI